MVNLRSLIGKLNETARGALEGAAGLCLSRTHYDIEIEHYVLKLMDASGSDIDGIFKAFDVDRARVAKELGKSLDRLKSGNARTPAFSPSVVKMLQEAWTLGSLDFEAAQVRTGFTILALVSN
jgi:type VI secretion system protein VasG